MSIRLARDGEAMALLADQTFRQGWTALLARCPWATVFQSADFVGIWYEIYRARFEPVLLLERDGGGRPVGLLPLAVARDSGAWVVAGGEQAEYQTWLADPARAPRFIEQALERLWHQARPRRLAFRYLPAGAPLDWIAGGRFAALGRLEAFACPLMALGDGSEARRSLAKRGNRSRLKRLARHGPLCYERITEPGRFCAMLDDFIADCDFRHGAVHGSLPFHDDPLKRAFLTALFEQTDLLDVTVTRSGDTMLGAHIGLRDRDRVYNGILVHSPFEARNSPGKLHVLQLARDLAQNGCRLFDLTPGGDPWKERFASDHETVHVLTLHGSAAACTAHRGGRALWRLGRDTLRALGIEPRGAKQALLTRLAKAPLPAALRPLADCQLAALRQAPRAAMPDAAMASAEGVRRNAVADLLLYAADGGRPRTGFLHESLLRFEHGWLCYSAVRGERLVYLLWLGPQAEGAEMTLEEAVHLRDSLPPAARQDALARALAESLASSAERLVFQAPAATADDLALLQRLGFTPRAAGA